MDHKVSKDMISSGMIPSGEKTQADLGRTQYGSAPSPSSLMDAYRAIYEHHQKDADGNVIPHEEKEELSEMRVKGGGVSTSLPKKKAYQKVVDKLTGYQQTQKGVGAASLIPDSSFSNPNPRRITRNQMNDVDLFDLVKGKLIDEGCDEQEAINIMVNLSEDELNEISEGLAGMALKLGGLAAGAYGVKKAAEKLGTMSGTPKPTTAPKATQPTKKPGLIQKLKDRRDATNKAIEQM